MILTDEPLDTPELVSCRIMLSDGDISGYGCKVNRSKDSPLVNSIPIINGYTGSIKHRIYVGYKITDESSFNINHKNYYLVREISGGRTQIELKNLFFDGYTTKLIPFSYQKYGTASIIEDHIRASRIIKSKLKRYLENCRSENVKMYFVAGNLYTSHYPVYKTFK